MFRWLVVLIAIALPALADQFRMFLKDGSFQVVREYKVEGDRVRYYSIERSDWEEIPLDMVDLKKTEKQRQSKQEAEQAEMRAIDEEEKAERAAKREASAVPVNPGAYWVNGNEIRTLPVGEMKVVNNKRRSVLKALSPIPLVTGKATVELDGTTSPNEVTGTLPEFYIRLSEEQRFGLVRLKPQKNNRLVETVTIIPVSNEMVEERDTVEIFRRQVGEGLYKIWPQQALTPGEYAIIEFTDGKVNIQVWDFKLVAK
jgi:hypothetical protein